MTDSYQLVESRQMNFRTYWQKLPTGEPRTDFATRCGSSVGYFNLIASGHKKAGPDLAMRIEAESAGAVTVEETCPAAPWHVVRAKPEQKAA